jgi:hypothetical protein
MKSNVSTVWGIGLFCLALIIGCSEFIEKDLTSQKVFLTSPSDSIETNKYTQSFVWEPVNNASYRMQIASPSFTSSAEIIQDTVLKASKYNFILEPGRYEWRVRAENSGSAGIYSTHTLIIHESSITNQQVLIKTPLSGFVTNQTNVVYSWHNMFGAKAYYLQIDTANFEDEVGLVFKSRTANTEFSVPLTTDKSYQWRVRAEADSVVSKWSPIQTYARDATPPEKVNAGTPANGQVVVKPVILQWAIVTGATKYQLVLYKSNGSTFYNSTFPLLLTTNSYSFADGDVNETLYWKVRAVDAAGNYGEFSDIKNFTIQ